MAIFASTTLGSSDPSRAMSIKALEARAQALAQAQAQQQTPASLPSPWQGAALVANQAVDAFATKRADWAAQQQRKELGDLISQVGPEGPNPQQLAGITVRDSDLGKTYETQAFQARQNAAATQAAKEAAAEKARQDEAAAVAQEGRVAARPKSPLGQVTADIGRKPTEEEVQAEVKKMTQGSPADQAAIGQARDENIGAQTTVAKLDEAADLLEKGIYHGTNAGNRTAYGLAVPNVLHGVTSVDDKTTERSQRYSQILSSEVVAQLKALKGPASNKDMDWATSTVNNPSATKKNKQDALNVLRAQAAAHLQSSEQTLKGMGTAPVKVNIPATGGAPADADPNAQAKAWLAANPNDPRADAVRKKLGVQ